MSLSSVKQEANLPSCIKSILESRIEVSDIDLGRYLSEKFQIHSTPDERRKSIQNSTELVNHLELRSSEGKVVYFWKDELTLQADKANLSTVESEIFKLIKNRRAEGTKSKWMESKLQLNLREVNQAVKKLISHGLIVEEKIGRAKYLRRPDVELNEAITGGFWQDDDDLTFDQDAIRTARDLAGICLSEKVTANQNSKDSAKQIFFGETVGCSIKEITQFIIKKNIFRHKPPKEKDVKMILECMRYDDLVNAVRDSHGVDIYYLTRNCYPINMGYSSTPCSSCSLMNVCKEEGNINPVDCLYFKDWLDK